MKLNVTINFTTKLGTKSQTSKVVRGKKAANTEVQIVKDWLTQQGYTYNSHTITEV